MPSQQTTGSDCSQGKTRPGQMLGGRSMPDGEASVAAAVGRGEGPKRRSGPPQRECTDGTGLEGASEACGTGSQSREPWSSEQRRACLAHLSFYTRSWARFLKVLRFPQKSSVPPAGSASRVATVRGTHRHSKLPGPQNIHRRHPRLARRAPEFASSAGTVAICASAGRATHGGRGEPLRAGHREPQLPVRLPVQLVRPQEARACGRKPVPSVH